MAKQILTIDEVKAIMESKPEMVAAINAAKSEAEVDAVLKQNGLDLTLADIKALQEKVQIVDGELDQVAGGTLCFIFGGSSGSDVRRQDGDFLACYYVGIGWGGFNDPT